MFIYFRFSASGVVTSYCTTTGIHFNGIAITNSGTIYATEQGNIVSLITHSGVRTVLSGTGASGVANGAGTVATFNGPQQIAAVNIAGTTLLYVADTANSMIRCVETSGLVFCAMASNDLHISFVKIPIF